MRKRRIATWIILLLVLIGVVVIAVRQPSQNRSWAARLAHLPLIETTETGFTADPVRDWRWNDQGEGTAAQTTADFQYDQLRRIWFVLEPDHRNKIVAHTFLLFEFDGDRLLGLSVEARTEEGVTWSAITGMFNSYELIYLLASARDLLELRAFGRDHELYMYPLELSNEQQLALLESLLNRAQSLHKQPRFYNTALSNCTNELAKATELPWRPAFVLTGTADKALYKLGAIEGASFAVARTQAAIKQHVLQTRDLPAADFDRALLAFLRTGRDLSSN